MSNSGKFKSNRIPGKLTLRTLKVLDIFFLQISLTHGRDCSTHHELELAHAPSETSVFHIIIVIRRQEQSTNHSVHSIMVIDEDHRFSLIVKRLSKFIIISYTGSSAGGW